MSHRKVRVFSKTQLWDTERGREKESGRKSISLHRRWWKDAPLRVIKTMKIQQRVTDRGLFALAGTARCLSAWPVARLPQSSGIFQASLISTNKAMGLFSVSHQPFGLSTICSVGPKPPCCHLNACSKDWVHWFMWLPLLWTYRRAVRSVQRVITFSYSVSLAALSYYLYFPVWYGMNNISVPTEMSYF